MRLRGCVVNRRYARSLVAQYLLRGLSYFRAVLREVLAQQLTEEGNVIHIALACFHNVREVVVHIAVWKGQSKVELREQLLWNLAIKGENKLIASGDSFGKSLKRLVDL